MLLAENGARPGAIAWRMTHGGESYIVALNSSDEATLLDNLQAGATGTPTKGMFAIDGAAPDLAGTTAKVPGRAGGRAEIQQAVDGRLAAAQGVQPDADGRRQARIDDAGIEGPAALHRLVAWDEASGSASAPPALRVGSAWQRLADVALP